MAKNINRLGEGWLRVPLTAGVGLLSGAQALVGTDLVVDLITDADAAGVATCMFPCAYTANVAVTGEDDLGPAVIAAGDKLYLDGAAVNADAVNGIPYGYALGGVLAGATTTIEVARGTF